MKKTHTQERKHIGQLNCQRFHFVVAKLTGEELQLPPNILKMPIRSVIVTSKVSTRLSFTFMNWQYMREQLQS